MSEHVHESDCSSSSVFHNRWIMVPVILVSVVGAVATIAGGFLLVYKAVTWIGNN